MLASEVNEFRLLLSGVADLGAADMALLWESWPWQDPRALTKLATAQVPDLVAMYSEMASGLTADQYDLWRAGQMVSGGRFRAVTAPVAGVDQVVSGVRHAVGPLWAAKPDAQSAQSLLQGMAIRHIMRGSADTMVESIRRDPKAVGWARFTRPAASKKGPCGYCSMFAARGAVYRKASDAEFKSHDYCKCVTAPSWDPDSARPVEAQVRAASKAQSEADKANTLAWIAKHFPGT